MVCNFLKVKNEHLYSTSISAVTSPARFQYVCVCVFDRYVSAFGSFVIERVSVNLPSLKIHAFHELLSRSTESVTFLYTSGSLRNINF